MTSFEFGSFAAHFCQSCAPGADIPDRDATELATNARPPRRKVPRNIGIIEYRLSVLVSELNERRSVGTRCRSLSLVLEKAGFRIAARSNPHHRIDAARPALWHAGPIPAWRRHSR